MRNLHSIIEEYTLEQKIILWWYKNYTSRTYFRIDRNGVIYHQRAYSKTYYPISWGNRENARYWYEKRKPNLAELKITKVMVRDRFKYIRI